MDRDYLLKLQNGSDVRGVAMETPGGPPVTLSAAAAAEVAGSFTAWLAQCSGKSIAQLKIGVGCDSRLTAEALKTAAINAITAAGACAADCGLASTPAMFMGCIFPQTNFDGALMITASHLPQNRNGLKFFTKSGGVDKADVTGILRMPLPALAQTPGGVTRAPLMAAYAGFLRGKISEGLGGGDRPLEGLHFVVDAGNGGAGFFVEQVLRPLGADCGGSQFLEPDGNFPNHQPNPENKEAMQAICGATLAHKADLGLIFDTDVDRMSAVLPNGRPVNRNTIIALMAAVLASDFPGATVVTDSVTSDHLTDFLENTLKLRHRRFKRGYRNVINEAVRLNESGVDCPLAIETSGHGALRENYFLDDGAYMAVLVIIAAARARRKGESIESLLAGYREPACEAERRIAISGEDFGSYGQTVIGAFEQRAKERGLRLAESCEGVRVAFPGRGWLLLRPSLHDPVLPLNVEGEQSSDCAEFLALAKDLLEGFERLDTGVLDEPVN